MNLLLAVYNSLGGNITEIPPRSVPSVVNNVAYIKKCPLCPLIPRVTPLPLHARGVGIFSCWCSVVSTRWTNLYSLECISRTPRRTTSTPRSEGRRTETPLTPAPANSWEAYLTSFLLFLSPSLFQCSQNQGQASCLEDPPPPQKPSFQSSLLLTPPLCLPSWFVSASPPQKLWQT